VVVSPAAEPPLGLSGAGLSGAELPAPADFGGLTLVGECEFDAALLLPSSTYLGLPKSGSYVYGSWRDVDGNLLRALRGVGADASTIRFLFTAEPGGQLTRHLGADRDLWTGPSAIERTGGSASFASVGGDARNGFEFRHEPDGCSWTEGELLAMSGHSLGPGVQWFNTWQSGACYAVTGKYRTSGTVLGRAVEGFVGHEIHYFPDDSTWRTSPFGQGREICWQQIANEYEDGSTVQATFACGADGWGFAMVHDEQGRFHCTTDVHAEATVRPNGYPESITYRFLEQSWTWRIDPQGERPRLGPGPMLGADGTCRRDGDLRPIRFSMGNSDWWTDGRADGIIRSAPSAAP
jgi:hypothetical protein